ncbi:AbrB/MazE/SpoVT family DNA-binding domain-containing protein [Candidatus Woesearchaeota archaeon]|nr:AbrB/MazE/SpoVT family DNA-binding domain-containing protein [Candidatus Woesearchaeota archaeon]
MEFSVKAKEWGNSLGIILPAEIAKTEKIKAGQEIVIEIRAKNVLRESFGTFRFRKPTDEMMAEVDKELQND